jgi:hypothetical protein
MPSYRRWTLSNILGGIIGIAVGMGMMFGAYSLFADVLSLEYCSGVPCDDRLMPLILVSGSAGGLVGGITGYVSIQKLLGLLIDLRQLLLYGLIGSILWPVVGIVSLMAFIAYILTIHDFFYDFFARGWWLSGIIYDWILYPIVFAVVPGTAIGYILSKVKKNQSELNTRLRDYW